VALGKTYKKKIDKVYEFINIRKEYSLLECSIQFELSSTTTKTKRIIIIQRQEKIPLNILFSPTKRTIKKKTPTNT